MEKIKQNRQFMHCPSFQEGMRESDQAKGIPAPPFGKEVKGETVVLPSFDRACGGGSFQSLLEARRSRRKFQNAPMTGAQLAFILWSAQGIQSMREGAGSFRPSPSGGARHPFETYIAVKNTEGLSQGIYLYHPALNPGEKVCTIERLGEFPGEEKISEMLAGQKWASDAPVVLFYSCAPYRGEWRYVDMSHRVMLIDLGHVGQNVMLAAEAAGLGSCCMASFNQEASDKVLGLDGINEYTVYAVAVGKPR